MTLATRCSRCHTVFRLEQAALSAAEGWVRCGRCREVFNAVETLFEAKPAAHGADLAAIEPAAFDASTAASAPARAESAMETAVAAPSDLSTLPIASVVAADHASGSTSDDAVPRLDAANAPAEPASEPSASDLSASDSPMSDSPMSDTPMSDSPVSDSPMSDSPVSDSPVSDTPVSDTPPASDRPTFDTTLADAAPTVPSTLADEDDARDLRAARMALFGPDSRFDEDSRYDTQIGEDGLERMSLWSDTRPAPPRRRTRRARPKAAVHRDDRDFELSETTVDVASVPMSIPAAMPSAEAVDDLIASNDRDTTFADYEPASGYEIHTRPVHRRPTVRLTLRVAAIVLGVGLVLQSVLHARDAIAAHWPSTEPALQRLCAAFGCEVEAPRDLQALQVQSVTFQEAGAAGLYGLNVVLFNRSDLRVRMPALDLRISDARGGVAARRVLTAAEMEHRERSIPPRSEAALQANLRIERPNVSGYEVTVFYP